MAKLTQSNEVYISDRLEAALIEAGAKKTYKDDSSTLPGCFYDVTDEQAAALVGAVTGTSLTGADIVALIDTELGSTTWQMGGGGGGFATAADLVTALNTELGSTTWQTGGGVSATLDATNSGFSSGTNILTIADTSGASLPFDLSFLANAPDIDFADVTHTVVGSDLTLNFLDAAGGTIDSEVIALPVQDPPIMGGNVAAVFDV